MIVLHAAISEGALLLWGETPPGDASSPPPAGGPRRRARPHPFAASALGVARAIADAAPCTPVAPADAWKVGAWLPTRGSRPLPSTALLGDAPPSRARIRIARWSVAALPLAPADARGLLVAAAGGERAMAPGVIAASDLRYWADALRLATTLVASGQFLPGLDAGPGGAHATWDPVYTGANAERLAALARRMPAAARALSRARTAPGAPAAEVLRHVMARVTDRLVRNAAGGLGAGSHAAPESAHDAWLSALRSPDGGVEWPAADLRQLAAEVDSWRAPIAVSEHSPYRLCFRLEEPAAVPDGGDDAGAAAEGEEGAPEHGWYLRYLLQPHDDPSLLVPVDEVWSGRIPKLPGRSGDGLHEFLIASLGQAAGLCPAVLAGLEDTAPAGCRLDADGAHAFLTRDALALGQAGFTVMLPAWWTRRGSRLQLSARARVRGSRHKAGDGTLLDAIARFDWELAIGERALSFGELEQLALLKSPLVRMRGRWVQVRPEEIRAAIEFWTSRGSDTATVRELVQMALGSQDLPGALDFGGVEADGWIGELLGRLRGTAAFEQLPPPAGFTGTLRPYQLRGYSWLAFLGRWGLGACLADDMGLGKTIQTLALIERDRELGSTRPVLLICPTSVLNNWRKEASRFTPGLRVLVHHGPGRSRGEAFAREARRHGLVISSYQLLARDLDTLTEVDWGGIVLDEAQNIKNPETLPARAARALQGGYRIALTGTPVENHVGELWSIMEFLNPSLLGTEGAFHRRFLVPIQAARDPDAGERLRRLTGPFILRRLKTDRSIISDLPEKLEANVYCLLTREQASLYASVVDETQRALAGAEGIRRRGLVLATISKLKQVCNHPAQFLGDNSRIDGRSGKLQRLTEMVEEVVLAGERALVFSQFAEMGSMIQRHLQSTLGREALFLHGGVARRQRDEMVERFQDEGSAPAIFVLSLKAGGTGLNLTAANHVFHFDRWWNPAVENQATDRAFRIGQSRHVQVHRFVCSGTLEERIDEIIERKREVADLVVGTGEGWLTELSEAELREVLALGSEAVAD